MIELELQYRVALDAVDTAAGVEPAIWERPPKTHGEALRADFDDLNPDKLYDVRVRYVRDGVEGDWATKLAVAVPAASQVADDDSKPAPPESVRNTSAGCLAWVLVDAGQVDGVEVKTVPGVGYEGDFEGAEPTQDQIVKASPMPLCTVPGGQRTALIRTVTHDGLVSDVIAHTFKTRELDDGLPLELRLFDESAAGYPGEIHGGTPTGGVLTADAFGGAADLAPAWPSDLAPAWTEDSAPAWKDDNTAVAFPRGALPLGAYRAWQFDNTAGAFGVLTYGLSYVWSIDLVGCDAGPGTRLTIGADVVSPNGPWRIRFRVLGESAPAWTFDGEPAFTTDSAVAWKSKDNEQWAPWPGQIDAPRAGRYQFQIATPSGRGVSTISALKIRATRILPEQSGDNAAAIIALQQDVDAIQEPGVTPVISADYTIKRRDRFVRADCSLGTITLTLPPGRNGDLHTVVRLNAGGPNSVQVQGDSGAPINGASILALDTQFDAPLLLFADGSWLVV